MPKITFLPAKTEIEAEAGTTILMAATRNGIKIIHECTEGICGTDIAKIIEGAENLSEKSDNEDLTLETMDAAEGSRLCCMAKVLGDVVVEIGTED
ncbi:(2Fe-2S)-binding protein [Alphaproteobacteria bacterium]|nr:(2Fe-2S)-binding protein [Alphaproteobacteria bacterium]